MRLTSIKLSGFKSFVDPTTVSLPSNFTVVVGPNGCGKSNIIDAVRWVMGESSASRLRGDALTDVIFSGAASRKPVSQATVELLFDNSDRMITGEFAGFDEISVKRTVARDGSNSYFLNGSRCRKRDITELFLGTGLGPRSYAIIEQGMISQVIDAKPEELRAHLEEAAGITLYKERRKETLGRIGQTRENLERLDDLRGEIGRQLEHLRGQAEQAGQYRQLQQQRQQVHGQWLALEYRNAQQQSARLAAQLQQRQGEVDAAVAQIQALDAAQSGPLQELEAAQQAHEAARAREHVLRAECTRLEQALVHAHALAARQQEDQAQADSGLSQLQAQLAQDRHDLDAQDAELQALQPQLGTLATQLEQAAAALAQAQARRSAWQQQWDQLTRQLHAASTTVTREHTRQELLTRQQHQLAQRQQQQRTSLQQLHEAADEPALLQAQAALVAADEQLQGAADAAEVARQQRADSEKSQQQADQTLQALQGRHQVLAGQLSALHTLQGAALGSDDAAQMQWLAARGLADAPRLGALLEVAPGWEAAVEAALGPWLEAVVVPAAQRAACSASWDGQGRCLLADAGDGQAISVAPDSLASKVQGPPLVHWLLSRVQLPGQAQRVLDWQLDARQQLHGAHASALGQTDAGDGVLLREQRLRELQQVLDQLAQELSAARAQDLQWRQAVQQARLDEQQALAALDQARQQQAAAKAGHTVLLAQGQEHQRALARSADEAQALATQQKQLDQELAALAAALALAEAAQAQAQQACDELAAQRQPLEQGSTGAAAGLEQVRQQQQTLLLAVQAGQARHAALEQALRRGQAQQAALRERLQQLDAGKREQAQALQQLVDDAAAARLAVEQAAAVVVQAEQAWQQAREQARQASAHRSQRQQWLEEQREQLVQLRLQLQAAELAAGHAQTQAEEAQVDVLSLLEGLAADADSGVLARQLRALDARLAAMGAVNLAAIEEFEQASQRHAWLDTQHADLCTALETLEAAMAKIDRQTRSRFKETFEKVNHGLQDLYPRLFGGGQAWLELTGEDLLEAGVSLMARPPGKKVSTLSLLSGGEKAMTAVALVFAIFQLNPAPFCLLDEVDAPLDEANVGRLAQMLRQMSDSVQFLSVSHNKATMEAADQLCGVTMREPGVSRLVSVDLQQASQLAGAA